jgi:hypothetical protein
LFGFAASLEGRAATTADLVFVAALKAIALAQYRARVATRVATATDALVAASLSTTVLINPAAGLTETAQAGAAWLAVGAGAGRAVGDGDAREIVVALGASIGVESVAGEGDEHRPVGAKPALVVRPAIGHPPAASQAAGAIRDARVTAPLLRASALLFLLPRLGQVRPGGDEAAKTASCDRGKQTPSRRAGTRRPGQQDSGQLVEARRIHGQVSATTTRW